jgi:hypothetical protein
VLRERLEPETVEYKDGENYIMRNFKTWTCHDTVIG